MRSKVFWIRNKKNRSQTITNSKSIDNCVTRYWMDQFKNFTYFKIHVTPKVSSRIMLGYIRRSSFLGCLRWMRMDRQIYKILTKIVMKIFCEIG